MKSPSSGLTDTQIAAQVATVLRLQHKTEEDQDAILVAAVQALRNNGLDAVSNNVVHLGGLITEALTEMIEEDDVIENREITILRNLILDAQRQEGLV